MKAVTLWQPWATWIALGWKTIETRTHDRMKCLFGETIAIHAGLHWDEDAIEMARRWLTNEQIADTLKMRRRHTRLKRHFVHPTGIVCTTSVWSYGWLGAGDSAAALCDCSGNDLFGLVLDEIRAINPPIPVSGSQGIWEWTPPDSVPAV